MFSRVGDKLIFILTKVVYLFMVKRIDLLHDLYVA